MPPSSPEPGFTPAWWRVAAPAAAILALGAVLTAWALGDVLHPRSGPDYAHFFIARDADCLQSHLFTLDVTRLPWTMDFADLSRAKVVPGHCTVGWNRPEIDRAWSSIPDALLVLRLAPGLHPTRLSATVAPFAVAGRREPASISLAGMPGRRPLFAARVAAGGVAQADAALPRSDASILTLLFHAARADRPSRLDPAGDPRHLGLALLRLELR